MRRIKGDKNYLFFRSRSSHCDAVCVSAQKNSRYKKA